VAKPGPKPKKGKNERFPISIPKRLHEYLGVLAEHSFIGTSETEIAERLLVERLTELFESDFHKKPLRGD
jgi:hypothetical protein